MVHAKSMEETSKRGVLGRHQTCSKERIQGLSNTIERHPFFTINSQLVVSRKLFGWKLRNHMRKSIWITSIASEDFFETWKDEGIGFRSCSTSRSQPTTQPNPDPNDDRTERPVVTEQTSRSSAQEIDTRFSRDCKSTNLFVDRLDEDKDTDKHVDADHDRTERPVVIGQPNRFVHTIQRDGHRLHNIWIATFCCETSGKFSCSWDRQEKIENHIHRQDLQDDLQQNSAFNPFSEKSKKMIQDMGQCRAVWVMRDNS